MSAKPNIPAPLSPGWAFVVQLREGTSFDPVALCGRIEHVASGEAGNFDSLDVLRRFMQDVLRSRQSLDSGKPTSGGDRNGTL